MAAEIPLWAANATGLIAPAVPWRGELRRLRHISVLAPLAACAQSLAEGYRWPMVPAYAMSLTLAVVWAVVIARTCRPSRWLRAVGTGGALSFSQSRSRFRCSDCRSPAVRTRSAPWSEVRVERR
ncbi:hypothetical protein [Nocardia fusca]|uniref:hypothetical protein n=1 Tax=Nocardia fusca TaxID=941183 RepID=UPI0007A75923|nr:hypothetical protein [Nocardia fusca]